MRTVYRGRPAAEGVALGRLHRVDRPAETARVPLMGVDEAFTAVDADLAALADGLRGAGRTEPADIVETNRLMAGDPDLRAAVDAAVASGSAPEAAVAEAVEAQAQLLASIPDETLAARAADVRAVGRRLLAHLRGTPSAASPDDVVVAAHEVSADDLLTAGHRLVGALSVLGGAGAHAAIVARALGVPLLVGLDPAFLDTADGTELVLDGLAGTAITEPEPAEWKAAQAAVAHEHDRRATLAAARDRPTRTSGGREVSVLANVGSVAEAESARSAGAPGVGLLRTEMPFLAAAHWPTEAEHVASLRPMLACFPGLPVTVRTLDFGADKVPPFLTGHVQRGLLPPDALRTQFRAILAAAGEARVRVMIPMVSTLDELRGCRVLLEELFPGTRPPLGAMVETPEAVAVIGALAAEADFLSIGSNDLTAALLGLDRRDPALTPARAAEPPVLAAIEAVVRAGEATGTPVSICGDAAADPAVVPLLVRMGCPTLSVAPAALDEVRAMIRAL